MKSLQLNRPHAIMMVGIPGSGKSFFAQQFAETFNAPYIDSLSIEDQSKDGEAAGILISMILGELAKTGQSFVFEGNSDSRVRRTEFARWARSKGYQPMLVWVQTDASTSLGRSLKANSLTREEFASITKDFSPPHPDEKPIVISGKHTYSSQARVVLAQLARDARPDTAATVPERRPPARPATQTITVR